ncbi:hypothetical protein FA13DRAFT_1787257 [Coprinellus micaceus]|uniref:C2H2-type domain-containing protein n=1 Tax=Coprinellus micaceus TaxID=71717 RepID=A0A4Y7TTM9_COPMI|nr:hypothetical protein FA13DRAFT_1787257 [Coprinellus micaceus]
MSSHFSAHQARAIAEAPHRPNDNIFDGLQRLEHSLSTNACEYCGRCFCDYSHLALHQRTCKPAKRGLSSLLEETKEFWEARKQQKIGSFANRDSASEVEPNPLNATSSTTVDSHRITARTTGRGGRNQPVSSDSMDVDAPIASRVKRKRRQALPLTEVAALPQSPATVNGEPMQVFDETQAESSNPSNADTAPPVPHPVQPRTMVLETSRPNIFHISKVYQIPSGVSVKHDPDKGVILPVPKARLKAQRVKADGVGMQFINVGVQPAKVSIGTQPVKTSVGAQGIKARQDGKYGPFKSKSAFELADWYWGSAQKSFSDFEKLLHIFRDPEFSLSDTLKEAGGWIQDDGWKSTPISIKVPFHRLQKNTRVENYFAGNFRHRSILSVIKEKVASADDSRQFYYQPYRATWKPKSSSPELELYGELYCSQAFRQVNEEVQSLPSTPRTEGLERVVVSLMFWSDGTHLTSFGGSMLWPCYMFFGNESKYRRCQPSERLGSQIAYFIKLPDTFKDYLKVRNGGKVPPDTLFSHCARELFQCQWGVLLDDDLVDAMKNGIVLICPDGKPRCFYPRIFTILIAGIRNNGGCPCHRCLIKKDDLSNLGAPNDTERRNQLRSEPEQSKKVAKAHEVILGGYAVNTDQVEALLKPESLVPTVTSLSSRLSDLRFKLLPALVVDLLHKFEIGVWKNLFIHLIRLLEAFMRRDGPTLTAELDTRYRATPAFGRDTIRKFGPNASEMKRKAARDYEDLLQCAIPAFEGILPEPHNTELVRLLYICAQWHALAKLRVHHDLTLNLLDYTTVRLGAHMRRFSRDTCETTVTRELPREAEARARREGSRKGKGTASRKPKKLGVFTIKFHSLGDYSAVIRQYGTTDSYSTETGELFHRLPKAWFERTHRKEFEAQLSAIERRQARLASICAKLAASMNRPPPIPISKATVDSERFEYSPESQFAIGVTQNTPIDLLQFAPDPSIPYVDPYLQGTIHKLKQHLLPRILSRLGCDSAEEIAKCDWMNVALQDSRLFSHKLMQIGYTTYDVRRAQDVIHIDTPQCNVMLLNPTKPRGKAHPYLYGRVIGIFHAMVSYIGQLPNGSICYTPHRFEFCWAHWYDFNKANDKFGLERVSPYPLKSPKALDFFDPVDILRAVHLIPQFSLKPMDTDLPAKSKWGSKQQLWNTYFINRFADRDLFMRYQYGMSIGHQYMHDKDGDFPPLAPIPSIPDNFDYGLVRPEPVPSFNTARMNAPSSSTSIDGPFSTFDQAPPAASFGPSAVAANQQGGVTAATLPGLPVRVGDPQNTWLASYAEEGALDRGGEEGEGEDDTPGEIFHNYDDDLDDFELMAYDNMYGTQVDNYYY